MVLHRTAVKLALLMGIAMFGVSQCDEPEKDFAVVLTSETFDDAIKSNNHFVKFFAPWCGHCKRLHPLWEQLAEMMNVDNAKVIISKVDCTKHQDLCSQHEVTGYPTLRFFKNGETGSVKFKGTRDMPAITEFITQQLRSEEDDIIPEDDDVPVPPVKGTLVELTDQSFVKHVSSGNHFVKFYAPWCSHCQRLAPTWEELSKSVQSESVSIGKIDCTQHRPICQDFDVKGYPTLLWIEDGKKIEKYSGSRELQNLEAYVKKMLGTETKQPPPVVEKDEKAAQEKHEVLQLTGDDFQKTVEDGVTFVKFYAPWCGHCQKLSPIWDQLAEKLHSTNSGVKIAKVDCTAAENKNLCIEQVVEGYPTLYAYKNGEKQSEYDGSRALPELQSYINKFVDDGHDEL